MGEMKTLVLVEMMGMAAVIMIIGVASTEQVMVIRSAVGVTVLGSRKR